MVKGITDKDRSGDSREQHWYEWKGQYKETRDYPHDVHSPSEELHQVQHPPDERKKSCSNVKFKEHGCPLAKKHHAHEQFSVPELDWFI